MTAVDRIVDALQAHDCGPRKSGGSWSARCPAHDDRSPSLSLRPIVGQVLLFCHAGCGTADVLVALNLSMRDLFDEHSGTSYRYDDGRVVHRTPDKKFRQSGVTKGTGQLYRLDQVRTAITNGEPIYLCEGEKDVHALESLGATATTAPMGSANFTKADSSPLRGAAVVAIVDADEAGKRWAGDVDRALRGVAGSLSFVRAETGKDAADHVAAGHGLDEFVPVDSGSSVPGVQTPWTKKEESTRPIPDQGMFHGVLGAVVDTLDPTTEADKVAVLVSLMAGLGVMIDTGPHLQVGNTRHPLLIWPLLFGRTSTGRKGEAWSTARRLLAAIDQVFAATNIETGLSSGEGLVERIKDVADNDPDDDKSSRRKVEWPGTPDKRLLVVEPEFGAVMARAKREGNTLASVLREAWDGRALAVLTKKRSRASISHIAVISHVTPKEFRIRRAEADLAGGSYNRFLPVFVERSKSIPIGEGIAETDLRALAATLRSAVQAAETVKKITLDDQAKKLWTSDLYEELIGSDHEDTAVAEFTRRAAPYCLRIAGLHAVLNRRDQVDADDLNAAAALVRYSVASARYVLEQTTGDPRLDRIRRAVADARTDGLSRTEISALFGRNAPVALLDELLAQLLTDPEFEGFTAASGGRPSTRYRRRKFLLSSSREEAHRPNAAHDDNPEHDFSGGLDATGTAPTCPTCGTAVWPDGLCVTCESGGRDAA